MEERTRKLREEIKFRKKTEEALVIAKDLRKSQRIAHLGSGRDLAKNILTSYPNLKRLFMSGYTANVIAHHGVLEEGVNFIPKPFSMESLGAKVRESLDEGKVKS